MTPADQGLSNGQKIDICWKLNPHLKTEFTTLDGLGHAVYSRAGYPKPATYQVGKERDDALRAQADHLAKPRAGKYDDLWVWRGKVLRGEPIKDHFDQFRNKTTLRGWDEDQRFQILLEFLGVSPETWAIDNAEKFENLARRDIARRGKLPLRELSPDTSALAWLRQMARAPQHDELAVRKAGWADASSARTSLHRVDAFPSGQAIEITLYVRGELRRVQLLQFDHSTGVLHRVAPTLEIAPNNDVMEGLACFPAEETGDSSRLYLRSVGMHSLFAILCHVHAEKLQTEPKPFRDSIVGGAELKDMLRYLGMLDERDRSVLIVDFRVESQ